MEEENKRENMISSALSSLIIKQKLTNVHWWGKMQIVPLNPVQTTMKHETNILILQSESISPLSVAEDSRFNQATHDPIDRPYYHLSSMGGPHKKKMENIFIISARVRCLRQALHPTDESILSVPDLLISMHACARLCHLRTRRAPWFY